MIFQKTQRNFKIESGNIVHGNVTVFLRTGIGGILPGGSPTGCRCQSHRRRNKSDMKHTKYDLAQMQSLPLEAKIIMTKRRIVEWYNHWDGDVYVSFSGGKDSTVLKHIVDSMGLDVPAVFVNTGLEYPEIQKFVREVKDGKYECFNPDVEILRPEMRFDEVIKKYGYPVVSKAIARKVSDGRKHLPCVIKYFDGTATDKFGNLSKFNCQKWKFLLDAPFLISPQCCDVMKKKPFRRYEKQSGRTPLIGTLACESTLREKAWEKTGCNAFDSSKPKSQPMSFWTEQDILHYIKKYDVPYCPVYGDIKIKQTAELDGQMNAIDYIGCYEPEDVLETTGCDRTGCMFCMFGCHLEKEPNRFQRMKKTHPKQYEYCMNQLGLKEVLEYIGVKYE